MKQPPNLTVKILAGEKPEISYQTNIESHQQIQQLLEMNVANSLRMMGIGSGQSPESSGEKVVVDVLRRLAMQDRPLCIFDVGANKGQFLDLIEKGLCDFPHYIHAFEPSQYTYDVLCKNARNYSNVKLNNVGLGSQIDKATLHYKAEGAGTASLYKRRLDHFGVHFKHSETVSIDTLDNYCSSNNIQSIELLKLDVEGHELDVLRGGNRMFNEQRIRMVSFEFGGCNIDSRTFFQDFYYFFQENGLSKLFRIAPTGDLVPILQYKEIYEQFTTTNFLAMKQ